MAQHQHQLQWEDESTVAAADMSIMVGGADSDDSAALKMLKPKFNSTVVASEDRRSSMATDDWRMVNKSLRLSPILHEPKRLPKLSGRRRRSLSENSNPLVPDFEPPMDSTPQFIVNAEESSCRDKKVESAVEEDKENMTTAKTIKCESVNPGTSTPVRCTSSSRDETTEATRSTRLTNPFESHLLENLCTSTFSPRLFAGAPKTPSKSAADESPAKFRWSIGQIAMLNPADIDESKADLVESPDPLFEACVQGAIDKFWSSQKFVLPSPDVMSGPLRVERSPFQHPSTARSAMYRKGNRNVPMDDSPLVRPGIQRFCCPIRRTKETQTLLTFPADLDLVKLLGGRFQYDEEQGNADEAALEANLSLNTSRRRLFADASFSSSKGPNESALMDTTCNSSSSAQTTADMDDEDDLNVISGNSDEEEECYLESVITPHDRHDPHGGTDGTCNGEQQQQQQPYLGRRRMLSPNISPIKFSGN